LKAFCYSRIALYLALTGQFISTFGVIVPVSGAASDRSSSNADSACGCCPVDRAAGRCCCPRPSPAESTNNAFTAEKTQALSCCSSEKKHKKGTPSACASEASTQNGLESNDEPLSLVQVSQIFLDSSDSSSALKFRVVGGVLQARCLGFEDYAIESPSISSSAPELPIGWIFDWCLGLLLSSNNIEPITVTTIPDVPPPR